MLNKDVRVEEDVEQGNEREEGVEQSSETRKKC